MKYNEALVDIEANSSATSYDSTTELERQNGNENEIGNAITKLFLYRILFTKYRTPEASHVRGIPGAIPRSIGVIYLAEKGATSEFIHDALASSAARMRMKRGSH